MNSSKYVYVDVLWLVDAIIYDWLIAQPFECINKEWDDVCSLVRVQSFSTNRYFSPQVFNNSKTLSSDGQEWVRYSG